ncbi:MAG: hypothetical protein COA73_04140 [Candidatus Hydrogenedentota bacterium]|nr:MAG: hypothetical protein COA73_04140 [Candidatus Hydrogenedentota bacterium]
MKHRFARKLCLGLSVICLASITHADTLELQNGDILEGLFKGGTQNSIRFSVDGTLKTIPVTDVLALTISRDTAPASVSPAEPMPEIETIPAPVAAPTSSPDHAHVLAPSGTPLLVRFVDGVDSREHKVGYRFAVQLESDFSHNGKLIAPRGSQLYGVLVDAKQAGRIKGKTHLTLALTDIRINDQLHPLTTGDYTLAGKKSSGKRSTLKILGGAALGAIIHDKDRAEGAAIGAGVGVGASAITRGEQITIPQNTLIEFRLIAPFSM